MSIVSKSTPKQRKSRDVGVRRFRQATPVVFGDCAHPVMHVHRVPRHRIVAGAVLLARVAYEEVSDYKIRPVVVVSSDGDQVSVRPCTTSPQGMRRAGSVTLADLEEAGLLRPTAVLARVIVLPLTDLVALEGCLSARDLSRVEHPAGRGSSAAATRPVTTFTTPAGVTPANLPVPRNGINQTHGAAA